MDIEHDRDSTFTAFVGEKRIVSGELSVVVRAVKRHVDAHPEGLSALLVFEDRTGMQCDFELGGTEDDAVAALARHPVFGTEKSVARGPGRPKLGVVSREVSLLPRHWEWLDRQPGGMSGTLRRLVDEARKANHKRDLARTALEAASKFMWVLCGNLEGFEEASRELFAKDEKALRKRIRDWPKDVRTHLLGLVAEASRLDAEARADEPEEDLPTEA